MTATAKVPMYVRVPSQLKDRLDDLADSAGMSLAQVVTQLLSRAVYRPGDLLTPAQLLDAALGEAHVEGDPRGGVTRT